MSQSQRGSSVDKLLYIEVNNLNYVASKFLGPARFLGPPITYIIKIQSLWLYNRGGVLRHYRFPKPHVCIWIMLLHFARLDGSVWIHLGVFHGHPTTSFTQCNNIYILYYIYKKLPKWSRASCNFRLWSGNKNESVQYITNYTPENWWTDASRCPMKPVNALSRPCRKTGHQTHRFTRLFGAIYCQSFHHQYHPKHFNKTSWACHFRSSACSILKAIFALPPQICFPPLRYQFRSCGTSVSLVFLIEEMPTHFFHCTRNGLNEAILINTLVKWTSTNRTGPRS